MDPGSTKKPLWCLVGGNKNIEESNSDTIYRKIKYTTSLDVTTKDLSSPFSGSAEKCVYHVELTDNDVNIMERRQGQRLDFFTLNELSTLTLAEATQVFLNENIVTIEELLKS